MITDSLDQVKSEEFGGKMLDMLNQGALAIMSSIGYQTGLFDTLSVLPPATSAQVAEAAGLNERYVREWLNAMVVGQIVHYEAENQTYSLPAEHAAWLTEAAGPNNMARLMQYVPLLGTVEGPVIECFQKGGGVPYSAFPRFQHIMADDSEGAVVSVLLEEILPLAEGLDEKLKTGIEVLDVGCGQGRALLRMAEAYPNSRFTGIDLSAAGTAAGRLMASELGLENIQFFEQDAAQFSRPAAFDLITAFDAIHDQAFPGLVLHNIAASLKPGGVFLMQDIAGSSHVHQNCDHLTAPFLYTVSTLHCMTVSLAQGGEGLGTMWGREKAHELLSEAGFKRIQIHQLPHDVFNDYFICQL